MSSNVHASVRAGLLTEPKKRGGEL
jgi:hypothetical protein